MSDNETRNKDKGDVIVESNQETITQQIEVRDNSPQKDTMTIKDEDAKETEIVSKPKEESNSNSSKGDDSVPPSIKKNAEFQSFLQLRDAIEKYQKEKFVQLIVKDSKLLKADSTRKIIPKVYHLVNHKLMYHSITYTCKCHGELRQRPGTRIKNVGRKRLNCPMYIRFKLSADLQKLVLFDIKEEHNHGIDPTTCQMTPRQQVYQLSRMKRKRSRNDSEDFESSMMSDVAHLISKVEDKNADNSKSDYSGEPLVKSERLQSDTSLAHSTSKHTEGGETPENMNQTQLPEKATTRPDSPLESCSSSCSDSDEEEIRNNQRLLPFPIRLIGSAITSSPELIASTKELLEIQKSKSNLEKQKLLMETKLLELTNTKLELEIKQLQKTLSSEISQTHDTTIYLQAP
ncbi:hypothetical protein ElyMa_000388100 [Elysia marginata]|uniref:ZSWIM3 N-terminal domain-containing protein n=1 Tax=Elysia marginata TaxID=1093978 RepID=A0AAV4FID7_9GAST|nr:hypothetical protein ElyMa_000388100 [Elysia marginata]